MKTTCGSVKYFTLDHKESVKSPKTLPSPTPDGLGDLLREILVFKQRRGAWWKNLVFMCHVPTDCVSSDWCKTLSDHCHTTLVKAGNRWLVTAESHRCSLPRQMRVEQMSAKWPLKRKGTRNKSGSGKWKQGQVGVTKHAICTLLFQKRGQPSACGAMCMFAFEEYPECEIQDGRVIPCKIPVCQQSTINRGVRPYCRPEVWWTYPILSERVRLPMLTEFGETAFMGFLSCQN